MSALHIPEAARKRHIAFLGMNGSGKTSAVKAEIIEPALAAGERICNIDPTGVGWGLRLSRTGKSAGFKVYIVGGDHGDWPLEDRDGELWAEIVGTSSDSFVFDTSRMSVARRSQWFTDFAEVLIVVNRGPLHVALDEAHLFAPQAGATGGGIAPRMLHATNNLLALGRSKGLRVAMISQRPAKLHKDSLTQAHALVAMMMIAPQDRNAVRDWVADQADETTGKDIIASLPGLEPGEGWIWAPRERVLERVRFSRPQTFDSSSAPETAEGAAVKLSPIDPEEIKGRLAQVAQEKKDNNPDALRMRVSTLTAQVEQLQQMPVSAGDADRAYSAGYAQGHEHGWGQAIMGAEGRIQFLTEYSRDLLSTVRVLAGNAADAVATAEARIMKAPEIPARKVPPAAAAGKAVLESKGSKPTGPAPISPQRAIGLTRLAATTAPPRLARDDTLTGAQREMLQALRWWSALGHHRPTRAMLAGKLAWKLKGSHLKNRISELKGLGLVDREGEEVALTPLGYAAAPAPDMSRSVIDSVNETLTGAQRELFAAVSARPGREIPREELAEALDWPVGGSHLKNRTSELLALAVLERPRSGVVRLAPWVTSQTILQPRGGSR